MLFQTVCPGLLKLVKLPQVWFTAHGAFKRLLWQCCDRTSSFAPIKTTSEQTLVFREKIPPTIYHWKQRQSVDVCVLLGALTESQMEPFPSTVEQNNRSLTCKLRYGRCVMRVRYVCIVTSAALGLICLSSENSLLLYSFSPFHPPRFWSHSDSPSNI